MLVYTVQHTTTYCYRQPVGFGEHRMMLRPRESLDQHLLHSELAIAPEPVSLHWSVDAHGNSVGVAVFSGRASELRFESKLRVAHSPSPSGGFDLFANAQNLPVTLSAEELVEFEPYLHRRAPHAAVDAWARSFHNECRATPTLECLTAITQAIRRGSAYIRRTERGIQAPALTLEVCSGTCRDFTVLMMDAVRALGLPARFVSGYLYVLSRDRVDIRGGGATHAWLQVYLPDAGWVDFDPTNATVGNAGLIRVAVAPEPEGATPLSGSFIGFRSDDLGMQVTVKVTREDASREHAPEPRAALRA